MRAEDGGVAGEVVEAVHDDGHHDVEHDEGAEEDEGDEVEVGHVGAARLVGVDHVARRLVVLVRADVALALRDARDHDVGPGLASRAPKSQEKAEFQSSGPFSDGGQQQQATKTGA